MSEQVAESSVVFTDSAARKVGQIIASEGKDGLMLRVYIQGGGCSGFQYGFTLEDKQGDDDEVIENGGVKLLIDPLSLAYLEGGEIDYKDDLMGARFIVNNPNASSTCGCGASFAI